MKRKYELEEQPEETYPDLLPYEMERAEAAMAILFPNDKEMPPDQKENLSEIRKDMVSAKMPGSNSWGHRWRGSPNPEDPRHDVAEQLRPIADDPIHAKAIQEFRESQSSPEDDDNIPATD